MREEVRTVIYDEKLQVEAYRFEGVAQPFPNHFHEYYVIGLMERGERRLLCRGRECGIRAGDILIFHPGDSHACTQCGGETLDYRGLNVSRKVMSELTEDVTGRRELPHFSDNVIRDGEIGNHLRILHEGILSGAEGFEKEEMLLLFMSVLLKGYGRPFAGVLPECREEIERACGFMEEHYAEPMDLERLCRYVGLSKSALIRAFTKEKGTTPYRYLESIRIGEAGRLLAEGASPLEAAMRTGFSDQSHFTNYFRRFIGLTPGAYREIFCGGRETETEGEGAGL